MQCPIDQETLMMTERQGIEIDYCPKCRGVWLDRGELDKLIAGGSPSSQPVQQQSPPPQRVSRQSYQEPYYKKDDDYYYKKKKKDSFLKDLFDF